MLNPDISGESVILIVSDVHLGASGANYDLFNDFLRNIYERIENKSLPILKVLIITGDFFDVCMDDISNLCKGKEKAEVYDNLRILQKLGIKIVLALGNHEIDVTGEYDDEFSNRKSLFIESFQNGFADREQYLEFFNEIRICQYCVLQKDNNNMVIHIYDSKKEFENSEISKTPIQLKIPSTMDNRNKYLFAHGFQFESGLFLSLASAMWKITIEADVNVKKFLNLFYNDIYKGIITLTADALQKLLIEPEKVDKLKDRGVNLEHLETQQIIDTYESVKKTEERREKIKKENKRYYKEIEKFLETNEFSHISHVFFGHTHKSGYNKHKTICNVGAWQHIKKPNFVEIYPNGEFSLKKFAPSLLRRIIQSVRSSF